MPITHDALGKIEAAVGWVDETARSAAPIRVYIQRPWRLFLTGVRGYANLNVSAGEVLFELEPASPACMPSLDEGEIVVEMSPALANIEAHSGRAMVSIPGGILWRRPAQRWVPFHSYRVTSSLTMTGDLRAEVNTTLSAVIEMPDLEGQAVSATIAAGAKTYVT